MKRKGKRTLTPKLRFPEFREAGEWKSDLIAGVATISKGRGISKADVAEDGITPCIRYAELYTLYGEVIHEVRSRTNISPDELVLSEAEDVILPASGETRADIATAACVMHEGVALGGDLNILRADLHGPFFSYLLNSPLRYNIARVAQGDTVAHLYPNQISKIAIAFPSPPEQQKIAECLSSLDGLVAAEGRMLEALKAHKKGLMQQLFPQPGQTQPRLRFPEFRDEPGWVISPLGRQFSERQEKGYQDLPLLSLMDKEGIVPQEKTNRKNNSNSDKSRYLRVVPGDIAYNTMRMWEGRSAHVGIEGLVSPAYTVCMPTAGINSLFFSYYFKTEPLIGQFRRYSQGLVKDTLNLKYEAFSRIQVPSPSPLEQKKIADCLSSLDGLIVAEGRMLEALKAHKKGLMQQLFPAPEEP